MDPITIADIEKRLRDALGDVKVDDLKKKPEEPPPKPVPQFTKFPEDAWWGKNIWNDSTLSTNEDVSLFDDKDLDETNLDGIF